MQMSKEVVEKILRSRPKLVDEDIPTLIENSEVRKEKYKINANPRTTILAPEGRLLISIDFSSQELYLAAVLSEDQTMLKAFSDIPPLKVIENGVEVLYPDPDTDLHTQACVNCTHPWLFVNQPKHKWKEIAEDKTLGKGVAPRKVAKILSFGILYMQSAATMAEQNYIKKSTAEEWIKKHEKTYWRFHQWKNQIVKTTEARGFTVNKDSRVRYCQEANSKGSDNAAGRLAVNMQIQGMGATMSKLAAIKVSKAFEGTDCRLLACVHDELLVEVPGTYKIDEKDHTKLEFSEEAYYWANKCQGILEKAESYLFKKYLGKDLPGKASAAIGLWWAH